MRALRERPAEAAMIGAPRDAPPRDAVAQGHRAAILAALHEAGPALDRAADWGRRLALLLPAGRRLLIAGNGGSAAEAQHLSAEFVGRYRRERPPFSAIALHADTSALTAIVNDYGPEQAFARQVQAHGAPGDVLLLLSTSGRSPNLVHAAQRAAHVGLLTWALTGPGPTPLGERCDEVAEVPAPCTGAVQEVHLVAVHVLCHAFDAALGGDR